MVLVVVVVLFCHMLTFSWPNDRHKLPNKLIVAQNGCFKCTRTILYDFGCFSKTTYSMQNDIVVGSRPATTSIICTGDNIVI